MCLACFRVELVTAAGLGKGGCFAYPGKTEEVGIAVGAAFGAVDLVQVLERELELGGQVFDSGAEVTIGQRRELVKEGLDHGGVEDDHDKLERDPDIKASNVRY
jgi:hypothetical protein